MSQYNSKARCSCGNLIQVPIRFANKNNKNYMCPECYLALRLETIQNANTTDNNQNEN